MGLAFDHPVRDYTGSSEDLFVYECEELTDEERAESEKYRTELGILPDDLESEHWHADEFPAVKGVAAPSEDARPFHAGTHQDT